MTVLSPCKKSGIFPNAHAYINNNSILWSVFLMKHLLRRVIGVSLSAVLGMSTPLSVTASGIGLGDDYERLIQCEEVTGETPEETTEEDQGIQQEEGRRNSRGKRPAAKIQCRHLLLF